ncbi:aldehyde ferredoxin oxidoreductase [Candidatus Bathyarchaeota archaeon]|nr:MAG: aldehyde ferredoxin oxidoreductase [Candidatus Bathyarchaeota archaeon]
MSKRLYSYAGKILWIDLTANVAKKLDTNYKLARDLIGARGFGAKILWDNLKPEVNPLTPDNILVISIGPLAGTTAQSFSRFFVMFKSPLTGTYFRSVGGGYFGAEMKFAGYDAIVVSGRAKKPTYLWIHDNEVEFRDASNIWGLLTNYSTELLLEETDESARLITIGPAGEKLVKMASIQTDDQRSAARGGGGTVLGSKNLKAIVVKGTKRKVELFDEGLFKETVKEQIEKYRKSPAFENFRSLGTNGIVYLFYTLGHFPTYNFKQLELENVDRFKPETLETYVVKYGGCYGCAMGCWQFMKISKGPFAGHVWDKPEYETYWSLGGALGITNVEAIMYANMLCDLYGVDTISTGSTIAMAYELYEKGILTKRETDGLELNWGDPEPLIELIRKIALKEGIGRILAEGSRKAAELIGRGAEKYAMHIKGLELPAYDPRVAKAHGLSLATSPIGGSHELGWNRYELLGIPEKIDPVSPEGKGLICKEAQDETAFNEAAGGCNFPLSNLMNYDELIAKLLYSATGVGEFKDPKYLWMVGERIFNLERAFNVREKVTRKDDTVPERILVTTYPRTPAKGSLFELDKMLDEYYKARSWDIETGIPTRKKLEELDLKYVADELEQLGCYRPRNISK